MNKRQKSTFNTMIGLEDNGQPTYAGKFTIDEMNQYLTEAQFDLKRVKAAGNERAAERYSDEIAGISAALVYAANKKYHEGVW